MAHKKQHTCKLCESCRRSCKQPIFAVMVQCPRYYAFKSKTRINLKLWVQQSLPYTSVIRMITKTDAEDSFKKRLMQRKG